MCVWWLVCVCLYTCMQYSLHCSIHIMYTLPSVLWHCWYGGRNGIRPVRTQVLLCWQWWFDWNFARLRHCSYWLLCWPADRLNTSAWKLVLAGTIKKMLAYGKKLQRLMPICWLINWSDLSAYKSASVNSVLQLWFDILTQLDWKTSPHTAYMCILWCVCM